MTFTKTGYAHAWTLYSMLSEHQGAYRFATLGSMTGFIREQLILADNRYL
jgi:hypothetical protein